MYIFLVKGYTFFVPVDSAFKSLRLDTAPDNLLSNKEGLDVLLSHFVKGRLYDKDIKNGTTFISLSGRKLHVIRKSGIVLCYYIFYPYLSNNQIFDKTY